MGFVKNAAIVLLTCVFIAYMQNIFQPQLPLHMKGGSDSKFFRIGREFKTLIDNGMIGGAFAIYHHGKPVADIWGGYADVESRSKWQENTITMVMSTTKAVGAVCIGMLVDRGQIDYDAPVSQYWPEFAQQGKAEITVRMLLNHEAGLHALDEPVSLGDFRENPNKVGKSLAAQKPSWEPGTKHGYHGFTHGMYLDQLIRHTDPKKRGVAEFFRDELSIPFGIDFFIGLPNAEVYRAARSYESLLVGFYDAIVSGSWAMVRAMFKGLTDPESSVARALNSVRGWQDIQVNNPDYRATPLSSATGMGTARGLAKLFGIIANGGKFEGRTLVSEKVIKEFQNTSVTRIDEVLFHETTYAQGMITRKNPQGQLVFGHHGHGGQYTYVDVHNNLAWTFITNDLKPYQPGRDHRHETLVKAMYKSIGVE